jgi:hypothetical protein
MPPSIPSSLNFPPPTPEDAHLKRTLPLPQLPFYLPYANSFTTPVRAVRSVIKFPVTVLRMLRNSGSSANPTHTIASGTSSTSSSFSDSSSLPNDHTNPEMASQSPSVTTSYSPTPPPRPISISNELANKLPHSSSNSSISASSMHSHSDTPSLSNSSSSSDLSSVHGLHHQTDQFPYPSYTPLTLSDSDSASILSPPSSSPIVYSQSTAPIIPLYESSSHKISPSSSTNSIEFHHDPIDANHHHSHIPDSLSLSHSIFFTSIVMIVITI